MLESLIRYFRQRGPQDDFKMSELFEALLRVAFESKEQLDLSGLPKRGSWGSQTERNFSLSIAEALTKAFAKYQAEEGTLPLTGNE